MKWIWLLLIGCCVAGGVSANTPSAFLWNDTTGKVLPPVKGGNKTKKADDARKLRDTLLPIPFDSAILQTVPVIFLPDSLIRDTLRYEFTRIKGVAYKSKFTKELYRMVFVNPGTNRLNVMRTQNSEQRFTEYAGKRIRNIYIKVLPPYGTSVYDTTYNEESLGWLQSMANKTHMRTAVNVVRKQLTLKPGMVLEPFELVQNEILLRRLDYMDDATIMVSDVEGDPGAVDLTVVCKDELSWGGSLESNFINSFSIGLENKNFMKLGHVLNYELSYRGRKDKKWGNMLEYKINSVFGTHFDIWGYYRNRKPARQPSPPPNSSWR